MKKIFVIIFLIICLFVMGSCGNNDKSIEGSNEFGFFIEIAEYKDGLSVSQFLYDPFTKVVYIYIYGYHRAGFSPYYTVENGEPVIALYGVNWTEADLIR